jgi:hypothetical protein
MGMKQKVAWITLTLAAASLPLAAAEAEITRIEIQPSSLVLLSADQGRRVLVSGLTESGERIDLSNEAELTPAGGGVKVEKGRLYPVHQGETIVTASARGKSAEFTVKVGDLSNPHPLSFVRDVAPILNKSGCTAGACHGSAKGKNGFKLSLRGYDPDFDYKALLFDVSGRRFNRVNPAQSLMLAKPTQGVPHEGGLRIQPGSRYYKVIAHALRRSRKRPRREPGGAAGGDFHAAAREEAAGAGDSALRRRLGARCDAGSDRGEQRHEHRRG